MVTQEPDVLTVLSFLHLGEHALDFLMELFNLSVAGVDIPAIWKDSFIISILKARMPCEQGQSYCSILLLCRAGKILEQLLLLTIVKVLGAHSSHRSFTTSGMLPISAREVSGFNQHKSPSRTIVIAVDISKAFYAVSHRLLIEMIHLSQHHTIWLDGLWHTSAAGRICVFTSSTFRLSAKCRQGLTRICHLPSHP